MKTRRTLYALRETWKVIVESFQHRTEKSSLIPTFVKPLVQAQRQVLKKLAAFIDQKKIDP